MGRTFDELEATWRATPPLPRDRAAIDLIVLRRAPGVHETPARARLTPEEGLVGDRWADGERLPEKQVTLMMTAVAEVVAGGERPLHAPGDNFLVGLDLSEEVLPAGVRLRIGRALIEVSDDLHLGCDKFRQRFGAGALRWVNYKPYRSRRLRGVHCRVLEAGDVAVGDALEVLRDVR